MATRELTIGEYSSLEEIGRGGSSNVFRALDGNGKTVAIKVLAGVWNEDDLRRFEREKDAMNLLTGISRIVPLLDSGTTSDGTPYLVTPYFSKGSLQDHLESNGPMPEERAVTLIKQVGETLLEVHDRNVFHRDLKPGNLLLDDQGYVWIADFGITQILDGRSLSTAALYTPGYCPPEAFAAGRGKANGRIVDSYGLAATLWALLAGHQPFCRANDESNLDPLTILSRVGAESIGRPNNSVSQRVCDVIETATAKKAPDRHASVHEFIQQLDDPDPRRVEPDTIVRSSQAATNPSPSPTQEPRKGLRVRATQIYLGVFGLIALSLLAVIALVLFGDSEPNQLAAVRLNERSAFLDEQIPSEPEPTVTTRALPTVTTISDDIMKQIDSRVLESKAQKLAPEGFEVSVTDGVATIRGTVLPGSDLETIDQAAALIKDIEGIDNVIVSVLQTSTTETLDPALAPETENGRPDNEPETTQTPQTAAPSPTNNLPRPTQTTATPSAPRLELDEFAIGFNSVRLTGDTTCSGQITLSVQLYARTRQVPSGIPNLVTTVAYDHVKAGPERTFTRPCGKFSLSYTFDADIGKQYEAFVLATNEVTSASDKLTTVAYE